MTRRKRKVSLPDYWDTVPATAAQKLGKVVQRVNGRTNVFRESALDYLVRRHGKRAPVISPRQFNAGIEISNRYARTLQGPGPAWTRVFVDSSPRPGDVDTMALEAKRHYAEIKQAVPRECTKVVEFVCCSGGRKLSEAEVALLRQGLDAVAKAMRL